MAFAGLGALTAATFARRRLTSAVADVSRALDLASVGDFSIRAPETAVAPELTTVRLDQEPDAVPRFQAGKVVFRSRGAQVVAVLARKVEKGRGDARAHHVGAVVVRAGLAAAVPVEAGERVVGAGQQFATEDIAREGHGVLLARSLNQVDLVVPTIFMAEAMRAETSVMLLGTMSVVVASAATLL